MCSFRPVPHPRPCGSRTGSGRYTNRTVLEAQGATLWVGSELEGRRRYQRKGGRVSCGQEVGRTAPFGPWMCRILRPTSCPLLYPQAHLNMVADTKGL
jgi:hypothetical protein